MQSREPSLNSTTGRRRGYTAFLVYGGCLALAQLMNLFIRSLTDTALVLELIEGFVLLPVSVVSAIIGIAQALAHSEDRKLLALAAVATIFLIEDFLGALPFPSYNWRRVITLCLTIVVIAVAWRQRSNLTPQQ